MSERAPKARKTPAKPVRRAPADPSSQEHDPAPAPSDTHAVLRLQQAAGNASVSRLMRGGQPGQAPLAGSDRSADTAPPSPLVVARDARFTPTFGGSAGVIDLEFLNADVKLGVTVRNAKSAPAGTNFVWSWGVAAVDGVERGDISPATGPKALFTAKAKRPTPAKAKDELAANLEVTTPGGTAVVHPVAPPMRVGVMEPEYTVAPVVVPGATGGGSATALKPSDVLELRVTVGNVDRPHELGTPGAFTGQLTQQGLHLGKLHGVDIPDDQPFQQRPARWDGDTLVFSVYCHHAGTGAYTLDLNLPGTKPVQQKIPLKAEAPLSFFLDRCNAATDRHRALLAVFDEYIHQGFLNYKAGYEAAEAAFKEYAHRQQLTRDILLGIMFAGIGGLAGGYVGGLVKFNAEQVTFAAIAKSSIGQAQIGAVTDAAKDMVKYTTRLATKVGTGGGGSSPRPDDATPDSSGGGGTSRAVPGSIDPLDWYGTVQKAKSAEEATIATQLQLWKTRVIDAMARGSTETVDFDPVNAITEITKLDDKNATQLGAPPSADAYEKNMWEAWIERYAYSLRDKQGCGQIGKRVVDDVGKELRNEMDRVESALAKKGVDAGWVGTALTEARRIADAKAERSRQFY